MRRKVLRLVEWGSDAVMKRVILPNNNMQYPTFTYKLLELILSTHLNEYHCVYSRTMLLRFVLPHEEVMMTWIFTRVRCGRQSRDEN